MMLKPLIVALAIFHAYSGTALAWEKDPAFESDSTFLIFGDQPYTRAEREAWNTRLKPWILKHKDEIGFIFHYGDTKAGGAPCTKEIIQRNIDEIFGMLPGRSVYVPGDNDWTDCDRDIIITDEIGQLDQVRKDFPGRVFFGKDHKGGESQQVRGYSELQALADIRGILRSMQEPKLPSFRYLDENHVMYLFTQKEFLFAGLHLVGNNNGWYEIKKDKKEDYVKSALERESKVIAALKEAFSAAKEQNAKALVLGMHVDMFDYWALRTENTGPCTENPKEECSGFMNIKDNLKRELTDFKKPVLVIHGDSTPHCLDQPWADAFPQLWRVNGPGDGLKGTEADLVIVRPEKKKPFKVIDYITHKKIPKKCKYKKAH